MGFVSVFGFLTLGFLLGFPGWLLMFLGLPFCTIQGKRWHLPRWTRSFSREKSEITTVPGGSSARHQRAPWLKLHPWEQPTRRKSIANNTFLLKKAMFGVDGQKFGLPPGMHKKSVKNGINYHRFGQIPTQIPMLFLTHNAWFLAQKKHRCFPFRAAVQGWWKDHWNTEVEWCTFDSRIGIGTRSEPFFLASRLNLVAIYIYMLISLICSDMSDMFCLCFLQLYEDCFSCFKQKIMKSMMSLAKVLHAQHAQDTSSR